MDVPTLFLVDERIKTFTNWPFSDKDKCSVRNMALAGFYSVSTCDEDADAAKCFLCGKELDGWEATDDPWEEHKSHAAQCAFVQLGKEESDLLLPEYLSVVQQSILNYSTKSSVEKAKRKVDEKAKVLSRRLRL